MPRYEMLILIDTAEPIRKTDLKNYVREAVQTWQGFFRPPGGYGDDDEGDPMFGNIKKVSIKRCANPKL